jgi:hypothetical protein
MKLRAILRLAVLLLAVVVWDGATFGQQTWRQVTAKDGSFTVDLPGEPQYRQSDLNSPSGEAYKRQLYIWSDAQAFYMVNIATYARPPDLRSEVDAAAIGMRVRTWSQVRWTTHQGLTAVDASGIQENGMAVRSFLVAKEHSMFNLVYARSGAPVAADVDRFVNSFLITK